MLRRSKSMERMRMLATQVGASGLATDMRTQEIRRILKNPAAWTWDRDREAVRAYFLGQRPAQEMIELLLAYRPTANEHLSDLEMLRHVFSYPMARGGTLSYRTLCGADEEVARRLGVAGPIAQTCTFFPRAEDIRRVVAIAQAVTNAAERSRPVILDVGCGNGFLSYLLASSVDPASLLSVARSPIVHAIEPDPAHHETNEFTHPNLTRHEMSAEEAVEAFKGKVDLVFNSFMPYGLDLTPHILAIGAPAVVYVLSDEGATGIDRTSYVPGTAYREFFEWPAVHGTAMRTAVHALTLGRLGESWVESGLREPAHFRVQLRSDLRPPTGLGGSARPYPWEEELQAELRNRLAMSHDSDEQWTLQRIAKKVNAFSDDDF